MNKELGELSDHEAKMVLQHRAMRARRNRPMTLLEKVFYWVVAVFGVVAVSIMFTILYQLKQFMNSGEKGEVTAPLTWIMKPKPEAVLVPAPATPEPLTSESR
jgi:hypothetical protein